MAAKGGQESLFGGGRDSRLLNIIVSDLNTFEEILSIHTDWYATRCCDAQIQRPVGRFGFGGGMLSVDMLHNESNF